MAWSLIVFYYHYLCCLSDRSASSFLFFVLFVLPSKHCKQLVPIQLYWSLAWSLVSNQGFLGKSYPGEVTTTSSSDLSKRLVACSIFNGNQGGRLSRCRRIIMYMYFFYSGCLYLNVFNVLNVLLLIFLVVLNVCTVNKVSFVSFYPILALSSTCFSATPLFHILLHFWGLWGGFLTMWGG